MFAAIVLAVSIAGGPPPVRGDFDHDGRSDVAEVVRAAPDRYQLIIRRGAQGHPLALHRDRNPIVRLDPVGQAVGDDVLMQQLVG